MTIPEYIDNIKAAWQVEIARQLHQAIQQAVPDAEERIQYGKPHYLKNGKYAALFGTAKGWVSFTIFNAASLEVPDGLFEPSDTNERQTIKIREGQSVDYDLITRLLKQAADTIK